MIAAFAAIAAVAVQAESFTVSAEPVEKFYDGVPTNIIVTVGGLPAGVTPVYEYSYSETEDFAPANAFTGPTNVSETAEIWCRVSVPGVTNTVHATATIKPRIVVSHARDGEWSFDGQAHTQPEYYEDTDAEAERSMMKWGTDELIPDSIGFIDGEGYAADLVMTSDSVITLSGTRPNVIDQTREKTALAANTKPENYELYYRDGTLTVTPIKLTARAEPVEKFYDGVPTNIVVTVGELPVGVTPVYEYSYSETEDFAPANAFTGPTNVSETAEIWCRVSVPGVTNTVHATATIKPRIVVSHARDGEWSFDGQAHTQPEYYEDTDAEAERSMMKWGTDELIPDSIGFIDGEGYAADLVMTSDSVITLSGTRPNVIDQTREKTALAANTKPENYELYYRDGTLTVTPAVTSATISEVKTVEPWDSEKGTITVDYSLAGIDTEAKYKVVFDITANGQTVSVTNDAAKLSTGAQTQKSIDTAALFGKEVCAKDAKVKVSLVAVPFGGVQLWKDGPYFAECNVGAENPEDFGYYFWWGDTVGYTFVNKKWVSVADGTGIRFTESLGSVAGSNFGKDNDTLEAEHWIDVNGNLMADHDAATQHLGSPWRMMTYAELEKLYDRTVCGIEYVKDYNNTGVSGYLITGLMAGYTDKSIFLPMAGYGSASTCSKTYSRYWISTPNSDDPEMAWFLNFVGTSGFKIGTGSRCLGCPVRPVRSAGGEADGVVAFAEDEFRLGPDGVLITLPAGTGYSFVVSNLTDEVAAEIAPTEEGGTNYKLPIGEKVGIYAVPEEGYEIVGTNPYVIDEVTPQTVIDTSLLPKVATTVKLTEVKTVEPWDSAKGTITVDYSLVGLDTDADYMVVFDITANGQTASVTNDAAKLTDGAQTQKSIDTAALFGKEVCAKDAKVTVSLVAVQAASFALSTTFPAAGSDYIIVAEYDGKYYALDNTENGAGQVLTCTEVFPENGNLACPDGCNCVFTAVVAQDTASSPNEGIAFLASGSEDMYLHLNSGKVRVAANTNNGVFEFGPGVAENTFTMRASQNGMDLSFSGTKFISKANTSSDLYFYAGKAGASSSVVATSEATFRLGPDGVLIPLGDGVWAMVDENGVCTIGGAGDVNLTEGAGHPLADVKAKITRVVVGDGITSIGPRFFQDFWNLGEVTIGPDVTSIGDYAFQRCYGLTNVVCEATSVTVGTGAFIRCNSLETMSFASNPTWGEMSFKIQAAIRMNNGVPEVYAIPAITIGGLSQRVMGKKTLADNSWTDVTDLAPEAKKAYHFFKIEMKSTK
ncbi:MAG: leucine-rich repeat protein [Kiritimatiellae bacterium]|nr:leucine-rich repeat protein [Kiritimatiellia bacterium]